jgi:hypothetical protein
LGPVTLGEPSRKRMRSMSFSACFISSMDCFLMNLASASYFQFSHISAWRKYWLMARSSSCKASFSAAMTFALPFM